jgi:excisionase family DNA binding protein
VSELIDQVASADADSHRLLTVDGAADYLAISRAAVYNLLSAGELRSVRIGRSRRVALIDLREFVERRSFVE